MYDKTIHCKYLTTNSKLVNSLTRIYLGRQTLVWTAPPHMMLGVSASAKRPLPPPPSLWPEGGWERRRAAKRHSLEQPGGLIAIAPACLFGLFPDLF